ncbi:hypothetical protein V9T40_005332 [Parthenolecanium corni]|uniref:Orotidine 5'-phosphate decarboxylase domain-containing protein n=1 Tax=Parthenolecanium corni TaxID=536013 RepID=A0AAN9TIZ6_9HEMI
MVHEKMDSLRRKLAVSLFEIDCLLFGNIKLSSELYVNAYFDLAAVFSYPALLNRMCDVACEHMKKKKVFPSSICGVSYSGVPFAALISSKLKVPLYLRSKEINLCAEDQRILGHIVPNNEVTIIEEVICSGTSTLQVIKDVEDAGMRVKNVFFMVDLEQGGFESLKQLGYCPVSLYKLSELRDTLFEDGYLNENRVEDIRQGWMNQHVLNGDCVTDTLLGERVSLRYESRLETMKIPIAQKLFRLILEKKTNLCVDLGLSSTDDIVETADLIGPYVCIIGIHLDACEKLNKKQIAALRKSAAIHNFLIMDDRKLSETGSVLLDQLRKILNIVDLVTVLPLPGNDILKEMNAIADEKPDKGIFFTGSLLTEDAFLKASFEKKVVTMGLDQNKSLLGFVTHQNSSIPTNYVHMMSDMRSTGSSIGKTKSSYYPLDLMTSTLGADVPEKIAAENVGNPLAQKLNCLGVGTTRKTRDQIGMIVKNRLKKSLNNIKLR